MDNATLRRFVHGILITVTVGFTTARIIGVELVYEPSLPNRWPKAIPTKMPTFGSNDRSRWAAIRALVENGTFVVGERKKVDVPREAAMVAGTGGAMGIKGYRDEGIVFQDGYKTVDIVKNPETNKFYSSKPPLFTAMAAGEYWLLNRTLGWTLTNPDHRWPIICTVLITFNVLPLIVFLLLLARLLEEYGTTDWGRLFVFASACFGTFLTTFAVTLNNHTPTACCVMVAVYPLMRSRAAIARFEVASESGFVMGGWDRRQPEAQARADSSMFLAGATSKSASHFTACQLFISGFFSGLAACFDLPAAALAAAIGLVILIRSWRGLIWFAPAALIPVAAFLAVNYVEVGSFVPVYSKVGTPWYLYEGSHWAKASINANQTGIDFAREPKTMYAFHMLFGHHGLFSLTPIWLFALAGMIWKARGRSPTARTFGILTFLMTAVVVAFYIVTTNNYEGWTSGPRWQFWMIPLFLLAMVPIADWFAASRGRRFVAYLFLAVSVFSAAYPVWNPWRHPWAYVLCEYMDWVKY